MLKTVFLFALITSAGPALLSAQVYHPQTWDEKLGLMIPHLFGPDGLTLPNNFHGAHFESHFIQESFTPVNTAIGSQIATLPFASPGSGFVYNFNSPLGAFQRSTDSFGPVLTERAETIGKRKLFIGFSYQYFSFDNVDGISLKSFPGVLRHEQETGAVTAVATYGVTNHLDVSVAIPVVNAHFGLVSTADIRRISPHVNLAISGMGRAF